MKKGQSYSELMKSTMMKKNKEQTNVFVQMMLDEILFNSKVNRLNKEIDKALDTRDYPSFIHLSQMYKSLMKHA